jgi:cell division protease FtsH
VDLERVARGMIGMSGADLRNLCNEAALHATRLNKNVIEQADFDAAADRVRLGAKREDQFPEAEKRRTAYHEAGHALCAWLEPHCDPLVRVSIIPRGQTGGVAMVQPDEDQVSQGQAQLKAMMVMAMGGRAADKLVFGEPRTGEVMDLKQATRVARAMVTQFGMSEAVGPVHYKAGEEHHFLGKEIAEEKDHSDDTSRLIDQEVRRMLVEAERQAIELLRANREKLDLLAEALLLHEELDRVDVEQALKGVPIADLRKPRGLAPGKVPAPAADVAVEPPALPGGLAFGGA